MKKPLSDEEANERVKKFNDENKDVKFKSLPKTEMVTCPTCGHTHECKRKDAHQP